MGLGSMDTEKKRVPWVPAMVEPPNDLLEARKLLTARCDPMSRVTAFASV